MPQMLQRVEIRNYRSIGQAAVDLEPLTVLVGPNGSGKSNFVDAISFVADSLSDSVELAFKKRGGIGAVRRRSAGHPTHIRIALKFGLGDDAAAEYAFEVAARPAERFRIAHERCSVTRPPHEPSVFEVRNGRFLREVPGIRPRIKPDRLALFAASATEEFRPVYDFLTSMRFYSIEPSCLRDLQDPDPGEHLKRDGSNAAAVLKRLQEEDRAGDRYGRFCRLLARVVDGLHSATYRSVGNKETIQFRQDVGQRYPWRFDALNMSDGTLRVVGVLLAVYQPSRPALIVIEEPEATVHPAIAELVVGVLIEGSHETQVLITTHSPDILDHKEILDTQIRVVSSVRGNTAISPLADETRKLIRERLYTPGELLRANELVPANGFSEARGPALPFMESPES